MFKFLKNKLKESISKLSKKVDEEAEDVVEEVKEEEKKPEPKKEKPKPKPKPKPKKVEKKPEPEPEEEKVEEVVEEEPEVEEVPEEPEEEPEPEPEPVVEEEPQPEKKKFRLFKRREKPVEPEPVVEEKVEEPVVEEKPEPVEEVKEEPKEKKGIFKAVSERITKKNLSEKQFNEIFWELEVVLLENNVAVEVIEKIKSDLHDNLVDKPVERKKIESTIQSTLKNTINDLFDVDKINLLEKIKTKKPYVICMVGINGSGKTTTIAKIVHMLKKNNLKSVLAAGDTFRAAAIQQLEEHANKLDVKMIKHDYGADAAAVAFDAIKYAEAHDIDVVLIDTAGRLHSNANLMDEMKKIKRVSNPDMIIFIGESITGNDCVEQAKSFDKLIGIDGIILSKADIDEKGGAAISISYVTKKPIMYLGTGQGYEDLTEFDSNLIVESLGL